MKQAALETRIAAAKLSTHLMAQLSEPQLQALESAVRGGASIILESGPLPDLNVIRLVLVEREGTRHGIASVTK